MNTPETSPAAPASRAHLEAVMASMVDGLAQLAAQAHPLHLAPRPAHWMSLDLSSLIMWPEDPQREIPVMLQAERRAA